MRRILSIDDDVTLLDVVKDILDGKGYQVFVAGTVAEAMRVLQEEEIDLVLLDVNMPEKHGFALYRELEARRHVPVLFVTACPKSFSTDSEEFVQLWENLFSLGTTDILYKPFNIDTLYEKVEGLIGEAEVTRMDSCSDLHINCAVRKVMVRHWIDLGKLSMRTTRGVVRLSGALSRLPGAAGHLNCALIMTILSELKRITHVRRVTAEFTNWTRSGIDGWTAVGITAVQPQLLHPKAATEKPTETVSASADGFKVYDVEEDPEKTA